MKFNLISAVILCLHKSLKKLMSFIPPSHDKNLGFSWKKWGTKPNCSTCHFSLRPAKVLFILEVHPSVPSFVFYSVFKVLSKFWKVLCCGPFAEQRLKCELQRHKTSAANREKRFFLRWSHDLWTVDVVNAEHAAEMRALHGKHFHSNPQVLRPLQKLERENIY